LRPIGDEDFAVGRALKGGRVKSVEFAAPPEAGGALSGEVREPVLPKDGANFMWWRLGEGIGSKKSQDVPVVLEKKLFGVDDEGIFAPVAERSEPKIPVKARLIGGVDARGLAQVLRLIAEGIRSPSDAIFGTLKFNFVAGPGHAAEKAVLIGDAEGLEQRDRFQRKAKRRNNFRNKWERYRVKNPEENKSNRPQRQG